jgi:hypothetical protein
MSSKTQEQLFEAFQKIFARSGTDAEAAPAVTAQDVVSSGQPEEPAPALSPLAATVSEVMGPGSVEATPAGSNVRGGATSVQSGSGAGSTAESIAVKFFESGFGIVPLISSLAGLFGGGSSSPPPLEAYAMPPAISFSSADTPDGLMAMNFDQRGLPRALDGGGGGRPGTGATPTAPQITVNVQAMDAQSFQDHSAEIAEAVRTAMLSMNSINDVVNEL